MTHETNAAAGLMLDENALQIAMDADLDRMIGSGPRFTKQERNRFKKENREEYECVIKNYLKALPQSPRPVDGVREALEDFNKNIEPQIYTSQIKRQKTIATIRAALENFSAGDIRANLPQLENTAARETCSCKFEDDVCLEACCYHTDLEADNKALAKRNEELRLLLGKQHNDKIGFKQPKPTPAAQLEWQPIKTAPTYGVFLVACKEGVFLVSCNDPAARQPSTPKHLSFSCFTHWMPLPPPPRELDAMMGAGE